MKIKEKRTKDDDMNDEQKIQMRKRNMKLFPITKALGWDLIFYYTINFLFLTQVKQINPADIVLINAFYHLFGVISQIPATFIIEFLGRKNAIILGNVLNAIHMLIKLASRSIFDLAISEVLCSLSYAIKDSAEPGLLNTSIPPTRSKSKIFAKISQKGTSTYYLLNAISMILSGFLYEINPYIPMSLSFCILLLVTVISMFYIEPIERKKKKVKAQTPIKDIKESMQFILKSERVKGLILYSGIVNGLLAILGNFEISLLEELNVEAKYIGILFAFLGIASGMSSKRQHQFHEKYRNSSLKRVGYALAFSCAISGVAGMFYKDISFVIVIIIMAYILKYLAAGIYHALLEKYLSNFTNKHIDTKIYTAKNLFKGIFSAISGVAASFLLDRMSTAYSMIIIGTIFVGLITIVTMYMKTRVGLKPEEYSKEELKYDSLKQIKKSTVK